MPGDRPAVNRYLEALLTVPTFFLNISILYNRGGAPSYHRFRDPFILVSATLTHSAYLPVPIGLEQDH